VTQFTNNLEEIINVLIDCSLILHLETVEFQLSVYSDLKRNSTCHRRVGDKEHCYGQDTGRENVPFTLEECA